MAQKGSQLANLAQEIEEHLRAVRQLMRRPLETEFARGGLTGPQRSVMQMLVRSNGISLKELSSRLGLAHSTVSGIIDRLQKQGMVERQTGSDRRVTMLVASKEVRDYLRDTLPTLTVLPLVDALRRVKSHERHQILNGLRTLRQACERGN